MDSTLTEEQLDVIYKNSILSPSTLVVQDTEDEEEGVVFREILVTFCHN